jgi:hypothetical protein
MDRRPIPSGSQKDGVVELQVFKSNSKKLDLRVVKWKSMEKSNCLYVCGVMAIKIIDSFLIIWEIKEREGERARKGKEWQQGFLQEEIN